MATQHLLIWIWMNCKASRDQHPLHKWDQRADVYPQCKAQRYLHAYQLSAQWRSGDDAGLFYSYRTWAPSSPSADHELLFRPKHFRVKLEAWQPKLRPIWVAIQQRCQTQQLISNKLKRLKNKSFKVLQSFKVQPSTWRTCCSRPSESKPQWTEVML